LPNSKLTFPICIQEKRFRNKLPELKRLPPDIKKIIENLQPFNKQDDPESHPLYILDRLWNDDKHETPHIVAGIYVSTGIRVRGTVNITSLEVHTNGRAIADGTEFMRLEVPDKQSIHNFVPKVVFEVAFASDESANGAIAQPLIVNLHDFVRDEVVYKFAPFFPMHF